MIQRIQTVYLLAAAILLTGLFFYPFVDFGGSQVSYTDTVGMSTLLIITTVIGYLNIFLYRKRMVQIRLCMLNCLLLLAFQGFIVYYFITLESGVFSLTIAFPIIAAILTFLGLRYIARDEAIVRTSERLR